MTANALQSAFLAPILSMILSARSSKKGSTSSDTLSKEFLISRLEAVMISLG